MTTRAASQDSRRDVSAETWMPPSASSRTACSTGASTDPRHASRLGTGRQTCRDRGRCPTPIPPGAPGIGPPLCGRDSPRSPTPARPRASTPETAVRWPPRARAERPLPAPASAARATRPFRLQSTYVVTVRLRWARSTCRSSMMRSHRRHARASRSTWAAVPAYATCRSRASFSGVATRVRARTLAYEISRAAAPR
jgi:hypothetical protein